MPSYSTNLNLAKPTVGGDTNQWGGYLNTNTDTLDGIFNAAGTGTSVGLQVGSGKTLKVGGTLTATGTIQLTGSQNELRFFEAIGGADNYVALKAPNEMSGGANYSLVLPAAQGTAGQFLKLTSLSGSEGLLQFADAGGQADNYFATSGLSNKDLGVGLHLKIADTGASVSSNADELVIENTNDAGLSILTANDAGGYVKFGDPQDDNVGEIAYTHDDNNFTFSSGSAINFKTNNTNRMIIDSAGKVGIGETNPDVKLKVKNDINNSFMCKFHNSHGGAGQYGLNIKFDTAPDNNSQYFLNGEDSSATRFIIWADGDFQNHDNSFGSISDERIKQDIRDSNSQWNDIKAVKVRNFKKKDDVRQYGENAWEQIGVVAQELEAISPKLIKNKDPEFNDILSDSSFGTLYEEGDEIPEGKKIGDVKEIKEKVKFVNYSILYMKSIKALQEAMDRIETLEAKVQAAALQEAITKIESLESEIDQLKGVN